VASHGDRDLHVSLHETPMVWGKLGHDHDVHAQARFLIAWTSSMPIHAGTVEYARRWQKIIAALVVLYSFTMFSKEAEREVWASLGRTFGPDKGL
jgi:hypothetical protein